MVTIKRKVEINLPQFIAWAVDNHITGSFYANNRVNAKIIRFEFGRIVSSHGDLRSHDTFTVEVEEVVTEDTELYLVERYISSYEDFKLKYKSHQNRSIKSILENRSPHLKTTHFYTEVNNELVLIWKNGKMVE